MTLGERLSEYVRACFTGLWVRTCEPDEATARYVVQTIVAFHLATSTRAPIRVYQGFMTRRERSRSS